MSECDGISDVCSSDLAVKSYDDRIDHVGACVGMKGSRIHGIVRELRNENIDVNKSDIIAMTQSLSSRFTQSETKLNRNIFLASESFRMHRHQFRDSLLLKNVP